MKFIPPNDKLNKMKLLILKSRSLLKTADETNDLKTVGAKITETLDEAHTFCLTPEGQDNPNYINQLLEIYTIRIALAEKRGLNKEVKSFFEKAYPLTLNGVVQPQVLGILFNCGGRARMREGNFVEASQYFSEAFKNYDSCRAEKETIESIKLKVVSSLLSGSKVNPFDDKSIKGYTEKSTVKNYERIVRDVLTKNAESFLNNVKYLNNDKIVLEFIAPLKRLIQKDLVLEVVKPYTNVSLKFISEKIRCTPEETENILVELILNTQIKGTIDQATAQLNKPQLSPYYYEYYTPLLRCSSSIDRIQKNVLSALS